MAKKANVDYDPEEDTLFISTGEKVKDSIEFDQFIFDFSSDDRIVGIEIMNASEYLKKVLSLKAEIDKKRLEGIKSASYSVIQQKEFAFIKVVMLVPLVKDGDVEREILTVAPVSHSSGMEA